MKTLLNASITATEKGLQPLRSTKSLNKLSVNGDAIKPEETHKMQVKGDMKLIQGDLLYTDEAGSKEYGIRQITKKVLAAEQAVADVSAGKKMIGHLSVGTTNDGTKSKLIVKGNIEMLDGDMKYKSDDGQTEYSLKEVSSWL